MACYSPWGHRVRHNWATELNWTKFEKVKHLVKVASEWKPIWHFIWLCCSTALLVLITSAILWIMKYIYLVIDNQIYVFDLHPKILGLNSQNPWNFGWRSNTYIWLSEFGYLTTLVVRATRISLVSCPYFLKSPQSHKGGVGALLCTWSPFPLKLALC